MRAPLFRAKLTGLATFSLIAFLILSAIHISSIHHTANAIQRMRQSHQRVVVFSKIRYVANVLLQEAYLTHTKAGPIWGVPQTLTRLEELRRELHALPTQPEWENADRTIDDQIEHVIQLFSNSEALLNQLDRVLNTQGAKVMARESGILLNPHLTLTRQVDIGIARANAEIDRSALEMERLPHLLMAVDIIGGLILAAALGSILYLVLGRLAFALLRLELGAIAFRSGDLSFRTDIPGLDELNRLSVAFDEMATELDGQRAVELRRTDSLQQAVDERTQALAMANEALGLEDRRRRQFLAEISHELRTPLTIMKGELHITLRAGENVIVDPTAVFARLLNQVQSLERLVGDLFLIARAEVGNLTLHRETINVAGLAAEVVKDFSHAMEDVGIAIEFKGCETVLAYGDPDRVRQMLIALLDNSIKHTRRGVRIWVSVTPVPEGVRLGVEDDGPGFAQVDGASASISLEPSAMRGEGSGLGLSVVKALAEAHDGSMRVSSSVAGGAMVCVIIPSAHTQLESPV